MDAETREIRLDERRSIQEETQAEEEDLPEEAGEEEAADEKAGVKPDAGAAGKASSISRMVKGATLAEALANGVKVASGMDIGEIEKKASKRDEDMRITGQMKIEEILAAWEAKQKDNAEAIEAQKKRDEEKLAEEKREGAAPPRGGGKIG